MKFQKKLIAGVVMLASLSTVAQAATLTIGTFTASSPGTLATLSPGTSYFLGDTGLLNFNTNLVNSSTTATKTFYDDFVFTIAAGSTLNNLFSASIQLPSFLQGLTGFSESLYSGSITGTTYSTTGTNPFASASLIATSPTTLSATNLSAGTYTLQFSGIINKATTLLIPATGSYVSAFSVSAVPEADTYAMMLAGLSLMGFMVQRRKNQQLS
jgi:hypothetical protein